MDKTREHTCRQCRQAGPWTQLGAAHSTAEVGPFQRIKYEKFSQEINLPWLPRIQKWSCFLLQPAGREPDDWPLLFPDQESSHFFFLNQMFNQSHSLSFSCFYVCPGHNFDHFNNPPWIGAVEVGPPCRTREKSHWQNGLIFYLTLRAWPGLAFESCSPDVCTKTRYELEPCFRQTLKSLLTWYDFGVQFGASADEGKYENPAGLQGS